MADIEQDEVNTTKSETLERTLRRINVEENLAKMTPGRYHILVEESNDKLEDSRRSWRKTPRAGTGSSLTQDASTGMYASLAVRVYLSKLVNPTISVT